MSEINSTVSKFIKAVNKPDISNNDALILLENLCNNCQNLTIIVDLASNCICHINKIAGEYFGYSIDELKKHGNLIASDVIHPDFLHLFPLAITHFNNESNNDKSYSYMYNLRTLQGWQWVYGCSQIAIFDENKIPKFIVVVGKSVNDILDNSKTNEKFISDIASFKNLQFDAYMALSKREKEILLLISKEWTSKEIAEKLFLSKASIDSYRKKILKLLNVKSAIGLTKYVLLFEEDED